jgi:hypothetical protein
LSGDRALYNLRCAKTSTQPATEFVASAADYQTSHRRRRQYLQNQTRNRMAKDL